MSASFPTSVVTAALLGGVANGIATTLSSGINNSAVTIPVVDTTGFPTAGYAVIESEVVTYTGKTSNSLTGVTRGVDGSSAASHSSGLAVSVFIVAAHVSNLQNEIIAIETDINARFGIGASSNAIAVPSGVSFSVASAATFTSTVTISATSPTLKIQTSGTSFAYTQYNGNSTGMIIGQEGSSGGGNLVTGSSASDGVLATITTNNLRLGTNNTIRLTLTSTGDLAYASGKKLYLDGINAAGDTYLYEASANDVILNVGGVAAVEVSTTKFISACLILAPDGSVGAPGFSYGSDQDTGVWRVSANTLAIVTGGVQTLTVDSNADVYTVTWTDYSGTSTIVGWSVLTTQKIFYKKIGKTVWVWWMLEGTSNSTSTSFTLPFTRSTDTGFSIYMTMPAQDNSATFTGAVFQLGSATNVVNMYKSLDGTAWTNSGGKRVYGHFAYQTA